MKRLSLALVVIFLFATVAFAATRTYQVTGPVLEVTPASITVQKGNEKWEIARDAGTKISGDLKVGSKVTIEYRMSATSVTVSEAKAVAKTTAKSTKKATTTTTKSTTKKQ